ncbi:hypothetical protein RJT34_30376 [Clitoria ternatea]|uniref:Uncharacterized protein n=1 Tax=Clitoria ternatea TaxID=43366 RepID=A0AAN9I401_CLITE
MRNRDEIEETSPPLSILQRLDRLERLMLFLEERHRYSAAHSGGVVEKCWKPEEEECKSFFSALEEVHRKGTLLERVALLENRLIQLSLDTDLGNTSRSSSFTYVVAEKLGHVSESLEDMNMITTLQENQDSFTTQDNIVVGACSLNSPSCKVHRTQRKAITRIRYNRKWLMWLKLGC